MDNGLLRIGAFSRATMLSIKALRAYHERGLLIPAHVDPETGYRAYHTSQLIDAAVIYRLRQLDLPLDAIATVLQARDPDVTACVLAHHEHQMRQQLADIERIVTDLQDGIDHPMTHTGVHVRDEPARHILVVRGQSRCDEYASFLSTAFDQLTAALEQHSLTADGAHSALYPGQIPDEGHHEVVAFVPITQPALITSEAVAIAELPATSVAALTYEGPYEEIEDAYLKLGSWVGTNTQPAELGVREHYLVSYTETDDSSRFRTEICWPIIST